MGRPSLARERPPLTSACSINHGSFDDCQVVTVSGELDLYYRPALERHLNDALQAGSGKAIVDLSAVSFLHSSALGALMGARLRAEGMGGWLRVVCVPGPVPKLFALSGVDGVLSVYPSVENARALR